MVFLRSDHNSLSLVSIFTHCLSIDVTFNLLSIAIKQNSFVPASNIKTHTIDIDSFVVSHHISDRDRVTNMMIGHKGNVIR
jgi:hypothetical protein